MRPDRPVLGEGARGEGCEKRAGTGGGARGAERLRGSTDVGQGVCVGFPAISTPGPRNVPTLTKERKKKQVTFFLFKSFILKT